MDYPRIAFIGGGNMAASMIGGLIADGWPNDRIRVAEPDAERRAWLQEHFGVAALASNRDAAAAAEVVVLAVKPQVLRQVARDIAPAVAGHQPLVVSIAAGVRTGDIQRWLGGRAAVVRAMPNTPALVQAAATGLYASPEVDEAQHSQAEALLRAIGVTVWVEDEDALDAVTALSGSGPAYFFLFIEALEAAGIDLGLEPAQARLLAVQTAVGAAKLALESDEEPALLRQRVTSPGGTTERALAVFEEGGLRQLVTRALTAARDRARELAVELGQGPEQ